MVLDKLYAADFSRLNEANAFRTAFFAKHLSLGELKIIHDELQNSSVSMLLPSPHTREGWDGGRVIYANVPAGQPIEPLLENGRSLISVIPSAIHIKGKESGDPFIILAQLHGNEPAGLTGVALAMALAKSGLLLRDVVCVIGNPLAAAQYFAAWQKAPDARQETRDAYRCGLDADGNLLPDGNRIPTDFLTRENVTPHILRSRELYQLATHACGILDIHSARGNMVCITDHKRDEDLKYSPIRAILTELAEAISAHASGVATVQTLKTILSPLPNIISQTGIEAGRHEDPYSPHIAASFTLSTLYNLGITSVKPLMEKDDGKFTRYSVQPKITYADLELQGELRSDDKIYMAREVNRKIEEYQYDEMVAIKQGQVVAVAKPSGAIFRAKADFSGIFFSKSAALYDKDPAVGPWPVAQEMLAVIKFCYPCVVSEMQL